jgi:hypothetical protein
VQDKREDEVYECSHCYKWFEATPVVNETDLSAIECRTVKFREKRAISEVGPTT